MGILEKSANEMKIKFDKGSMYRHIGKLRRSQFPTLKMTLQRVSFVALLSIHQTYILMVAFKGESLPSFIMVTMVASSLLLCSLVPLTLAKIPRSCLRQTVDVNSNSGLERTRFQALFLLLLWTISIMPQLMISVRESLFTLLTPVVLVVLAMTVRSRQEIKALILLWAFSVATWIVVCTILILLLGFPEMMWHPAPRRFPFGELFGFEFPRIAGFYGGHAQTGMTAAVLILVSLAFMRKWRVWVTLIGLVPLIMSESRNALIAVLLGVVILILPRKTHSFNIARLLQLIAQVSGILAIGVCIVFIVTQDPTLNGRLTFLANYQLEADGMVSLENERGNLVFPADIGVDTAILHNSFLRNLERQWIVVSGMYFLFVGLALFCSLKQLFKGDRRSAIVIIPVSISALFDALFGVGDSSVVVIGWLLALIWSIAAKPQETRAKSQSFVIDGA